MEPQENISLGNHMKRIIQAVLRKFGFEVRRRKPQDNALKGRMVLVNLKKLVPNIGGEGDVDRIVFEVFFSSANNGVFVEVGAARPDFLSIGALFRSRNWRVISVEPNPVFCELHRVQGLEILQYACGEQDEDDVESSIVHSQEEGITNESFSSLSIKDGYRALKPDLNVETIRVNLRRLDTILQEHAPDIRTVDCLSIDVEGWEIEVLEGFDIARFMPRVLIIENLLDDPKYRDYMNRHGYSLWKTIFPNEIYTRI